MFGIFFWLKVALVTCSFCLFVCLLTFCFLVNFNMTLFSISVKKKSTAIYIGIVVNPYIALGKIAIFTVLILPVPEHVQLPIPIF